jgi:hypothetical protein
MNELDEYIVDLKEQEDLLGLRINLEKELSAIQVELPSCKNYTNSGL